ncbi:pentapeptide repeat protein (plasmid) [Gloeocapsa sp. PCC 7428]|uniref:pentapeptide repeat-containing protein n=1 Tax=Gloeocapsa sp. PCC 7428 TaxID=1173026 RepID=UPI0002A5E6E4|nr:pentapeptide repeat-containing protein [Gloeocapsa sp. PCC 7428]AFZ33604.1 pentapeptide repeat protein [Gloeocapsa sp. PCC 7428]
MANEEHLALLRQGVEVWNKWRENNSKAEIDLSGANLRKANLRDANFRQANLRKADLSGANLVRAAFLEADLSEAKLSLADLSWATFRGTNLRKAKLRGAFLIKTEFYQANLSEAKLSKARFSMALIVASNLSRAILKNTVFIDTNLGASNLSQSNLRKTQLIRTQVLGTNFNKAILTGGSLVDWHTNNETNLDDVICEYVYLKHNQQERRPSSGNFTPGEFTKLLRKALDTVDLIFSNGIDWRAFLTSFQKLKVECGGNELFIQAIENKNDGAFVIRVNVPPDANKEDIENYLKREYEYALKALEEKYRYQSQAKDELLADYRQRNTDLTEIVKLMAARPISNVIEVTAKAESESTSETSKYNLSSAKFGGGFAGDQGTQIGGTLNDYSSNLDYSSKQSLAEAAAAIQQLLTQLQTQGHNSEEAQQQIAKDLAEQAQSNPTVMGKLIGWGKSLGDAAAKTTVSEAAKEVFKLALGLSGVPLP